MKKTENLSQLFESVLSEAKLTELSTDGYEDCLFRAKSIIKSLEKTFDFDTIKYAFLEALDPEPVKKRRTKKV